jgi:uncharacterized membrane protein YjgN (DUF898 family)
LEGVFAGMGLFDVRPMEPVRLPHQTRENFTQSIERAVADPFDVGGGALQPGAQLIPLAFTGKTADYFRIWLACQWLTVLTLGIYGPWARRRKAQYIASHWKVDGEGFGIELDPFSLLMGRIFVWGSVAVAFVLSYFAPGWSTFAVLPAFIALPWLVSRSYAFRWSTMQHQGVGFSSTPQPQDLVAPAWTFGLLTCLTSWLTAQLLSAPSKVMLIWWSIALLAFFAVGPWLTSAMTHQRLAHARWGNTPFELHASVGQITWHMIKASWAIVLCVLLISAAFGYLLSSGSRAIPKATQWMGALGSLTYLLVMVFALTAARARRMNFVLNRLRVGGYEFRSSMPPLRQGFMSLGFALLAVATFGLSLPWSTVFYNRWRAARVAAYVSAAGFDAHVAAGQPAARSGWVDEVAAGFDLETGL